MSDDDAEMRAAGPLADADLRPDEGEEGEDAPEGVRAQLLGWYRRNVGEPDSLRDVYLGFALFFGGVAMGLVGLGLYVIERAAFGVEPFWALRKVAFSVAAIGLPTLIVGIVVLLPVDRRALVASVGGYGVSVAAIGAFAWIYPYHWNVPTGEDYSPIIMSVYAVGLIAVVAASGSALVSYHVEQTRAEGERREPEGEEESVREADVQRDIEDAMSSAEMTWGGVERDDSRKISVSGDVGGDQSGFESVEAQETRSSGSNVDDAVANLKGMKGGEERTGRGSGTDEQTEALRELKKEKEAQEVARKPTLVERVKAFLGLGD
jgi:hypothetical protein